MQKRALIITYYWPPAGGPGVQRWLNFVKYFREFDIEPLVYVPENPHYALIDKTFLDEIPTDVEIIRRPIKEPYRYAAVLSKKKTKTLSSGIITKKSPSIIEKILLYIRGNCFIPDARIGWVKPSVNFLNTFLSKHSIDVIITSGPPHSMHLIGLELKQRTKIRWIADFRDPWTTIHYHNKLRLSSSAKLKHKKFETDVLQNADEIVVTSPTTKKEFELLTNTPIALITNGFEISDKAKTNLDSKFTCAHIGSLLSDRNPIILWKVISELAMEYESFKEQLELKFVGAVSDDVLSSIYEYGLKDNINVVGYVPHDEAIQFQYNAQVLLLVEIDSPETRAIIPGKLFEYMAAARPIIALGPDSSDIQKIVSETKSGAFFTYQEESQLKAKILEFFELYKVDKLHINSSKIDQYSRRTLTNTMANLIHEVVSRNL